MERYSHRLDIQNISDASVKNRRSQAVVETASVLSESHHKADIYFYLSKGGKLYSPTAKKYVDEVTLPGPDQKLLSSLQSWANANSSGMAIWVSPPIDENHQSTKITVSEIKAGRYVKQVKNTAQLVDVDSPVELANALLGYSVDPLETVNNEAQLREKLIIVKDVDEAWELINQYVDQKNAWKIYKEFVVKSTKIYSDNRRDRISYANAVINYAGNFRLGCDTISTVTPVFGFSFSYSPMIQFVENIGLGNSEGKWVESCGQCGVKIKAVIKKGYECSHCHGVYQGC